MTQLDAHHRAPVAYVTENREALEAHADSEKKTARIAIALLQWADKNREAAEMLEVGR